jgi:hypothetical protein
MIPHMANRIVFLDYVTKIVASAVWGALDGEYDCSTVLKVAVCQTFFDLLTVTVRMSIVDFSTLFGFSCGVT